MKTKHMYFAGTPGGSKDPASRRGFILLVVTVVVILLSLAAYGYMNSMAAEHAAAAMFGRDVEARMAAESAVEFAACQIALKETDPSIDVYHNPGTFHNQAMNETDNPRGQVRFSIVVPDINGTTAGMPRSGLSSENAKFNINRLMEFENDTDDTTDPYIALSYIPNMTEDITNAILDWIDSDEEARLGGAESVTYQGLAVPYSARNAPLESIDELLQIQGVTPQLFYGEDANRNGVLDPNEDDGAEKSPSDDADGILDAGFRDYLTVSSRERNTLPGGDKKININNGIIAEMFDFLEEEFDTETATFITAYRMKGDQNADSLAQGKLTIEQQQLVDWIAKNISSGELGQVTRGGMDLSEPPTAQFRSIYDLIDAKVEVEINGSLVTLASPWTSDAGSLLESMPLLEAKLTVLNDEFVDGRININQAPKEILMAMPDITEKIADDIISARPPIEAGGMSAAMMATRVTPAWLLAEGWVDLPTFKRLGPWLTTGGDVYSFQAVGHFDEGGPTTRLEAMIDATKSPPRIVFQRDLTHLGRGFTPALLDGSPE
ncbi:MAG: type II secretion system protein GspK [Planctomycetales bacterium]|jgi:type II secretory pathway component PulK|nr:type II secretion system protein GspK [Planctomycetales bacterium]